MNNLVQRKQPYLGTRRTRARVAENQALMSAVGPQPPPARVPAGVRHAPGVERRVDHLAAVAGVARGDGRRGVGLAAVGARPDDGKGPISASAVVLQILKSALSSLMYHKICRIRVENGTQNP